MDVTLETWRGNLEIRIAVFAMAYLIISTIVMACMDDEEGRLYKWVWKEPRQSLNPFVAYFFSVTIVLLWPVVFVFWLKARKDD